MKRRHILTLTPELDIHDRSDHRCGGAGTSNYNRLTLHLVAKASGEQKKKKRLAFAATTQQPASSIFFSRFLM
jgi:Fe-S oxidoreductase